ncbi:hypothetical protein AK830_g9864 [Neonectria ditissima]|uniref:Uncharacterized protein n=1 Tax=Neonectria ditissima TaxID=78410 RepID=A0A0P7AH36_9HYPO|nr:hypothetical protein AK830_g9864 [Neonectria ditissima]
MTDDFFRKAPSTFASYNITQDQIDTLEACVNGKTTPEDAAAVLTAYPEASPTPLEMQQRLGGLWTLLNDTAVGIMSAQSKIIAILQVIRTLPRIEEPKGEGEDYINLDDGFVWRELSGWAIDWADNYNRMGASIRDLNFTPADRNMLDYAARFTIDPSQGQERAARKQAWISANAYTARLALTSDVALTSYGAALERARYVIKRALEREGDDTEPDDLEAAAQLFIYAAPELYRPSTDTTTNMPSKDNVWNDRRGCYMGRWDFWMDRWASLAREEGFSTEVRTAADEAFKAMQRVES